MRETSNWTMDQFEAAWQIQPQPPTDEGVVRLLVRRLVDEGRETPQRAALTLDGGLAGDRWALRQPLRPAQQITLMNVSAARLVAGDRLELPGDNVLVDLDLSEANLPPGQHITLGTAVLEISAKPHLGCKKFVRRFGQGAMEWVNQDPGRARRMRGVNCRILEAGEVAVGDRVIVLR